MDGAKQNERGQDVDEGSGHGRQRVAGNKKPAEQATAGEHSQRILRPAQASKHKRPQMTGFAAKTQLPTMMAGLPPCR